MAVHIRHNLQAAIFEQMQQTYPNEGGGFLLGELRGGDVHNAAEAGDLAAGTVRVRAVKA